MTTVEVQQIVNSQSERHLATTNDHRISLGQALLPPKRISVFVQIVQNGRVTQTTQAVWLVGREGPQDGYSIVMQEDGIQFGLAVSSFPGNQRLSRTGWYGGLVSAFLSM